MCTTKMRVYLDKFVNDIVDILGNHYANTPPDQNALPGVQKAVAEVLGVCYIQSAIKRQKNPDSQSQDGTAAKTEETYARYLIHQAVQATGDPGRLQVLLEALERSLEVYQVSGNGFRISIPLTAAWIVLRGKSERTNPPRSRFVWPSMPLLVEYLEKALAKHGETARDYAKGIDVLLKTADKKALPFTPQDLDQQLSSFVADGHENEVVDAWLRYRDHLGAGETKSEPGSIFDPDPDVRRDVLGKFLYYLNAPKFNHRRPSEPDRIERCTREAVQLVPRPIPLSIHHTLVAAWARAFDTESELESGEKLVSLDAGPRTSDNSQTMTTKRERTLQKLHATWEAATQDGLTRDVKLYMLFMEGLGQLGDVAGLQKTWNELVDDEACKRRHFEDHDDGECSLVPTVQQELIPSSKW